MKQDETFPSARRLVALFAKQGTITSEMAEALGKISVQRAVVANLEEEMENRQKDIDGIVEDQGGCAKT